MRVEVIREREAFYAMREEWNELVACTTGARINLTHQWLTAWLRTLGADATLLILRVIGDDGQTVGIAPLYTDSITIKGLIPYKRVLFLGDPEADFSDFIIPDNNQHVLGAMLEYLVEKESWGELLLHYLPEISPNAEIISQYATEKNLPCVVSPQTPSYYIPIAGREWEEYYETTGKKFVRRDMNRLRNHFAGLEWEIKEYHDITLDAPLYEQLTALHASSQERKGRDSAYTNSIFFQFLQELVNECIGNPEIRVFVMTIGGKQAAYMLGFEHSGTFYWWNTGFNKAFGKLAPSKFMLCNVLEDAFRQGRWKEFSFMRGEADYKRHWTSYEYNLVQIRIHSHTGIYGMLNRFRNR